MTEAEILAAAAAHARASKVSMAEWLQRIRRAARAGNPSYAVETTEWFKALKALELLKQPAPKPPPTPPPSSTAYQYICHMAENPLDALKAPSAKYKVWFTADPAYDQYATRAAADQCRAASREVGVWYVPTQVSKARADEVATRLGVLQENVTGECENAAQFDASLADGRHVMIGILSALRPDQKARIASGEVKLILEHYWNLQPGLVIDYENLPVVGVAVAVYDGHGEQPQLPPDWHPRLADYIKAGRFPVGSGVYGPGMLDEDWALLK